jgi:hypothetical protein
MSEAANHNFDMLGHVADGLGEELLGEVAFVGGATTWLLCTDDAVLDDIRYTEDVDLVIELAGIADWKHLTERLSAQGFKITSEDSDYTCRFRFHELIVDVMPSIPEILGYANRWFVDAWLRLRSISFDRGSGFKSSNQPISWPRSWKRSEAEGVERRTTRTLRIF